MTEYAVGKPEPIKLPVRGRPITYPFAKLTEKGMTFFVPEKIKHYNAVYLAVRRHNKRGVQKFVVTKGEHDGMAGGRVQRIS